MTSLVNNHVFKAGNYTGAFDLYVIRKEGWHYIGITQNLSRRFLQHAETKPDYKVKFVLKLGWPYHNINKLELFMQRNRVFEWQDVIKLDLEKIFEEPDTPSQAAVRYFRQILMLKDGTLIPRRERTYWKRYPQWLNLSRLLGAR